MAKIEYNLNKLNNIKKQESYNYLIKPKYRNIQKKSQIQNNLIKNTHCFR